MAKAIITVVLTACVLIIAACLIKQPALVRQLETDIRQQLPPGAPERNIISFMNNHGLFYVYDDVRMCFQASSAASRQKSWFGMESVVALNVFVNKDKTVSRTEVQILRSWF
jgi:hypothetical protein